MQKSLNHTVKAGITMLTLGVLGLASNIAFANTAVTPGAHLVNVAMTSASPAQIKSFANAVKQIKPLNEQAHAEISQKGISATKQETVKKSYVEKVNSILASNHLSSEQYASMLKQTQTDPAFAKQVEAAMQ